MNPEPPLFPIGPWSPVTTADGAERAEWISAISKLPAELRRAVDGLSKPQLDTKYRNWTIRQIVHHIADSHVNSYVRFKWALTEDAPTIKAYDEGLWSNLPESQTGDVGPSLQLIDGLHARWTQLLSLMGAAELARVFHHPESGETVSLTSALSSYAWHGKHHTGQILWVRQTHQF